MPTGNQEYIRDMNRSLVLEAIVNHPVSITRLAAMRARKPSSVA